MKRTLLGEIRKISVVQIGYARRTLPDWDRAGHWAGGDPHDSSKSAACNDGGDAPRAEPDTLYHNPRERVSASPSEPHRHKSRMFEPSSPVTDCFSSPPVFLMRLGFGARDSSFEASLRFTATASMCMRGLL